MRRSRLILAFPLLAVVTAAASAPSAELRARIAQNPKIDLRGQDLTGADLSHLDLSGANLAYAKLADANLTGTKLVGTDLTGANLSGADLTGTWIMNARFDHANLHGATLQVVITSRGMENSTDTAASFAHADLSDTHATVHFSRDDLRGANFSGTDQSVVLANQSMGMLRSEYVGANLEGADFAHAKLGRITFEFAHLENAVFREADLTRADFDGAYLNGADFTGATLDGATFNSAVTTGAKGLPAGVAHRAPN